LFPPDLSATIGQIMGSSGIRYGFIPRDRYIVGLSVKGEDRTASDCYRNIESSGGEYKLLSDFWPGGPLCFVIGTFFTRSDK
jgi:hypothetical protein